MTEGYSFDELHIGQQFNNGTLTVTETHLVNVCALFGDSSPLHSSSSYAQAAGFRDRIVPGILTAGLVLGPISRLAGEWGVTHFGDELEYLAPVYIGDELSLHCKVEDKQRRSKWGVVKYFAWAEDNQARPVIKARAAIAHRYQQ